MTIDEVSGQGFYCYRNPKHAGKNFYRLFTKLGISVTKEMVKAFSISTLAIGTAPQEKEHDYSLWRHFTPAVISSEALTYLESRHFLFPKEVCKKFDLRIDSTGKWAGRLLIPLTIGWTGRAMRDFIEPRYLSETDDSGLFVHGNGKSAIVIEGPIDAMRIASVTNQFTVIAGLGSRFSPSLFFFLRQKRFMNIYDLPDGDADPALVEDNRRTLASYCAHSNVKLVNMPRGVKDMGMMDECGTREWLATI
jgi:hypothetical protein